MSATLVPVVPVGKAVRVGRAGTALRGRGRLVLRVGMAARVVGVVRAGRAVVPGSAGLMVMVARAEP
ncbi:hypothetical protein, partial [Mycobacterium szulgai]|uniref:hypothetical protein n=1 Tax=Mycobacterium szulgai TaxID=1787 RepID=UPI0021F2BA8E